MWCGGTNHKNKGQDALAQITTNNFFSKKGQGMSCVASTNHNKHTTRCVSINHKK